MRDSLCFPGADDLVLIINEKGQMEFVQVYGGSNILSDDDVKNLTDMCLGYLRKRNDQS